MYTINETNPTQTSTTLLVARYSMAIVFVVVVSIKLQQCFMATAAN